MDRLRRRLRDSRARPLLWAVAAALLLRALIPVGYMANYAAVAGEGPLIVLCPTGLDGHAAQQLGLEGHGSGRDTHSEAPCIFAAVAAVVDAPLLAVLAADLRLGLAGWLPPRDATLHHAFLYGTRRARAPPLSL